MSIDPIDLLIIVILDIPPMFKIQTGKSILFCKETSN